MTASDWKEALAGQSYMSLTTFRKNGSGVATPVWFAPYLDGLCVWTREDSWKVKRLRNNPRARVAPCTARGTVTGPSFEARAEILPPEDEPAADSALARKYGLQFRVGRFFSRLMGRKTVFLVVHPG